MNEKPVPAEVRGWNWGAFFLTWIWGIGNKVWISLLCLLPLVNIVMIFVLGIKGNEWAWKSGNYANVAEFHKVQKIWGIVGVSVFLLCFILGGVMGLGIVGTVFTVIKESEPYKIGLQRAQQSPQLKEALGEPIKDNWWVSGETEMSNGEADCKLQIPILGPKGTGTVYVDGEKHAGGDWQFSRLTAKPDNGGQEIDLNVGAGTPAVAPKTEPSDDSLTDTSSDTSSDD